MNWLDPYVLSLLGFILVLRVGLGFLRRERRRVIAIDTAGTLLLFGAFLFSRQIAPEAGLFVGAAALGMYLMQEAHRARQRESPTAEARHRAATIAPD
jgi:hypothetical protein